jgi:predicted transcriptional regulator of viral defense system
MNTLPAGISRMLRRSGTARSSELEAAGLQRAQLSRLVEAGQLKRMARGLYALPAYDPGEQAALLTVVKRNPHVVLCLLTALRLHAITTQSPFEVWLAIGNKDHAPRLDYPPLRIVRFSPASLAEGVETRKIGGATARITSVGKTVADCFKFRNTIGLDVALEALREALRERKTTVDALWHFARVDRVANVMRPYLETIA